MDTTGNIMVDIADGIGMVSKGIEALEYWLDPGSEPESDKPPADPAPPASPPAPAVSPETPPPQEPDPAQPKVFCQKGKCYPYDPAKLRNSNLNLEMKPGMILTPVQPQQQHQEQQQRGKHSQKHRKQHQEEDEEESRAKTKGYSTQL